eukprot:m.332536 g.332536  ORF g.332536 m.332536 type:complete len:773 (+) comp16959_c0_seq1:177-2495(+)
MEDHQATMLWLSTETGDHAAIEDILETTNVSPSLIVDEEGCTLLHTAAANGHEDVVRCLIERDCDLNAKSFYQWTPLMQASAYGHSSVISLLINRKADVNAVNVMGASALVCASRGGHAAVVHALLNANASVNNENGIISPIMAASIAGHESVCRVLIDNSCDINAKHPDTLWTPLMFASLNGYISVVQVLLSNKCDANAFNALGHMALDIAHEAGHTSVESYLSKRSDVSMSATRKLALRSDIFEATKTGDYELVKTMLDANKDLVNKRDTDGATCLMYAAMRGHLAIAEILVDNGADVDVQDEKSLWTALMFATYYGHKSIARLLIDTGATISLQARNGCTAFDIASIIGDTEVVRLIAAVSMRGALTRNRNIDTPKFADIRLDPRLTKVGTDDGVGYKEEPTLRPPLAQYNPDLDATVVSNESNKSDPNLNSDYVNLGHTHKTKRKNWWSRIVSKFKKMNRISRAQTVISTFKSNATISTGDAARELQQARRQNSMINRARASSPEPPPWRRQGGLIGAGSKQNLANIDSDKEETANLNASAPISKLPADIMAPIKPPFMPPPAFELSHIERPKFERPSQRSLPEVAPAGPSSQRPPSFKRPIERQHSWALPRKSLSDVKMSRSKGSVSAVPVSEPSRKFMRKRNPARVSFFTGNIETRQETGESGYNSVAGSEASCEMSSSDEKDVSLLEILEKQNLRHLYKVFEDQEVDLDAFITLDDNDLQELGITDPKARASLVSLATRMKTNKVSKVDKALSQFRTLSLQGSDA